MEHPDSCDETDIARAFSELISYKDFEPAFLSSLLALATRLNRSQALLLVSYFCFALSQPIRICRYNSMTMYCYYYITIACGYQILEKMLFYSDQQGASNLSNMYDVLHILIRLPCLIRTPIQHVALDNK